MIRPLGLLSLVAGLMMCAAGCSGNQAGAAAPAGQAPAGENVAQAPQRPQGNRPAGGRNDEVKSSLVRSMLDVLDGMTDQGTDEEHGKIRSILLEADEELHRTLESDLTQKIRDANKRPDPFRGNRPVVPPGDKQPAAAPSSPPATSP